MRQLPPIRFDLGPERSAPSRGTAAPALSFYLHPARADTFPPSVIEAMACGRPVVASKVGGIPEQIVEGETGFLTAVGDSQGMS